MVDMVGIVSCDYSRREGILSVVILRYGVSRGSQEMIGLLRPRFHDYYSLDWFQGMLIITGIIEPLTAYQTSIVQD